MRLVDGNDECGCRWYTVKSEEWVWKWKDKKKKRGKRRKASRRCQLCVPLALCSLFDNRQIEQRFLIFPSLIAHTHASASALCVSKHKHAKSNFKARPRSCTKAERNTPLNRQRTIAEWMARRPALESNSSFTNTKVSWCHTAHCASPPHTAHLLIARPWLAGSYLSRQQQPRSTTTAMDADRVRCEILGSTLLSLFSSPYDPLLCIFCHHGAPLPPPRTQIQGPLNVIDTCLHAILPHDSQLSQAYGQLTVTSRKCFFYFFYASFFQQRVSKLIKFASCVIFSIALINIYNGLIITSPLDLLS